MKKITITVTAMMMIMAIMLISPTHAVSNSACINANTLVVNTTINSDTITEQKNCPTGCSTTLNSCRSSSPIQLIIALGIFAGFIVLMWLFETWGWFGLGFEILLIAVSVLIASYDIFSSSWITTMFWLYPIIFVGLCVKKLEAHYEKREDEE